MALDLLTFKKLTNLVNLHSGFALRIEHLFELFVAWFLLVPKDEQKPSNKSECESLTTFLIVKRQQHLTIKKVGTPKK